MSSALLCPNCGREHAPGTAVCPQEGTTLERRQTPLPGNPARKRMDSSAITDAGELGSLLNEPGDATETGIPTSGLEDDFSQDTQIREPRSETVQEVELAQVMAPRTPVEKRELPELGYSRTLQRHEARRWAGLSSSDVTADHTQLNGRMPEEPLQGSAPAPVTWSTPSADGRDPLIGSFLGDYKVEERIGQGGMGIVYKGCQPRIGKPVAIKVLRREVAQDPEHVERLLAEARAVNAIHHRGIIDIFGFGELPTGQPYVVMELLDGVSLDRVIAERAPMPPNEVIYLLEDLLAGLGAAHAAGVIHRDLKPNNLFIVEQPDGSRYVKILDFGLSKKSTTPYAATPQTRLNAVVGTPEYMAPEQARALPVSPQTDLYSLGVILFEMLTGKLPFEAPSALEMLMKHVDTPAPRVSSRVRNVPAELDGLVSRLLDKSPDGRPASAEAMAKEVRRLRMRLATADTQVRAVTEQDVPAHRHDRHSTVLVESRKPLPSLSAPQGPGAGKGGWAHDEPARGGPKGSLELEPSDRTRTALEAPLLEMGGSVDSDATLGRSPEPLWTPRRLLLGLAAGGVLALVGFLLFFRSGEEAEGASAPVLALPARPTPELGSISVEPDKAPTLSPLSPPSSAKAKKGEVQSRRELLTRIARLEKTLSARPGSTPTANREALAALAVQRAYAEMSKDEATRSRVSRALDDWEDRFLSDP